MKRFLLTVAIALIVLTISAAYAAGNYVPSGERAFPNALIEAGATGFMVHSWELTDAVRAEDPADDSMTYTALPGTKLLHVKYITRFATRNSYSLGLGVIQMGLVDGNQQAYSGRHFVEGSTNVITSDLFHETLSCDSHPNKYLLQVAGSSKEFNVNGYALCDFVVEIPDTIAGTDLPLYLTINVGKAAYYIQVQ